MNIATFSETIFEKLFVPLTVFPIFEYEQYHDRNIPFKIIKYIYFSFFFFFKKRKKNIGLINNFYLSSTENCVGSSSSGAILGGVPGRSILGVSSCRSLGSKIVKVQNKFSSTFKNAPLFSNS